jgi:2-methylisocitrate lyase-like PEP mutase family enzyme
MAANPAFRVHLRLPFVVLACKHLHHNLEQWPETADHLPNSIPTERIAGKASLQAQLSMSTDTMNSCAQSFKALHVPGQPLLLANVFDTTSAIAIAPLPNCAALATASLALALANDTTDPDLSLDMQLSAIRPIAAVAHRAGKPLSVDLQSGYGAMLEEAITRLVELGVVGISLEDSDGTSLFDETTAVQRITQALAYAKAAGMPDFVINARSDAWLRGGSLDEAIRRGKLYLSAGATTVFILGRQRTGPSREEVERMVDGLEGKVNIGMRLVEGALGAEELAELGVARVSVGPQIYFAAVEAMKKAAAVVFGLN